MADTRDDALVAKETALITEIERLSPDFARSRRGSEDVVLLHGKEVRIIEKNREAVTTAKTAFVQ